MSASRREVMQNAPGCQRNKASETCLFRCFLIVIAAILVYQVVLIESLNESQPAIGPQIDSDRDDSANSIDVEGPRRSNDDRKAIKKTAVEQTKRVTTTKKDATPEAATNKSKQVCEYVKTGARWGDCESDGSQRKVMRLKKGVGGAKDCKPTKTIRRDCEAVGCKYARGQWSSACVNGQRFREDKLVRRIGTVNGKAQANDCKPVRRVTKDCRRTCHYIKSAWSECTNGFKTRLLILDESMGGGTGTLVADSNDTAGAIESSSSSKNNSDNKTLVPAASNQAQVAPSPIRTAVKFQRRLQEPQPARQEGDAGGGGAQKHNIENENSSTESSKHSVVSRESHPADDPTGPSALSSGSPSVTPSGASLSSRTCARHKLIRRECRRPGASSSPTTTAPNSSTGQTSRPVPVSTNGVRGPQRLHSNTNNMTPAQRRRLKQIQLKQQQQQEKQEQARSSVKADPASSSPAPTTSSTPTLLGTNGGGGTTTSSTTLATKRASRFRR